MVRVLPDESVARVLAIEDLLGVVETAFERQGDGAVERPPQPNMDVGIGLEDGDDGAAGNVLFQPGYIHGREYFVTKIASVHAGNRERGLPTVNVGMVLTEATTGVPAAYLHGSRLTNAKTGCVGGLAARELAVEPATLGVIGAGTQARWQTRAIAATTDLTAVRIYSPSDSKFACAEDLKAELDVPVEAVDSARDAVADAGIVATTTTATEPVLSGDDLAPGTLVVAIGAYNATMRELDERTFERAARVVASAPENVAEVGEVIAAGYGVEDLVPFPAVLAGETAGRERADEIVVFESAGSAVLDAACAEHVYREAVAAETGTTVPL